MTGSTALRPDEAFRADPYTGFEMVRRRGNVLRSYANRGWLVIGYPEAQQILRDPAFSNDLRRNKFMLRLLQSATGDQSVPFIDNPPLLNQDLPNHTRLRKLASAGFASRYIRSLEPVIQDFVTELLTRTADKPTFDVIDSLAEPLPAMVIAEMMGSSDRSSENVPEIPIKCTINKCFYHWSEKSTLGLKADQSR